MSKANAALAMALGASGGLFLWYLFRDEDGAAPPAAGDDTPTPPAPIAPTATAPPAPAPPAEPSPARPCSLRLDASGLTADRARVDVPAAVARCKAAGRAELTVATDGPAAVYIDLNTQLREAGVPVTIQAT